MSDSFPTAFSADEVPDFPFEFERKFFVTELPKAALEHGSQQVIIQAYIFAEAGYAVRVRLSFRDSEIVLPKFSERTDYLGAYERKVLASLLPNAEFSASIAVKSPAINGERYELETELDKDVAVQIISRASRIILKQRYSLWIGQDGWEFDVFAGENEGLIIAECERLTPVVDLAIPDFCITEVTNDLRFTNDSLSKEPWSQWDTHYRAELAARGPYFLDLKS
ncbi:MAG: adenylate cyclase [Arcanobacterium sp.]|nr:adenylate cyclase [Arcanobacterium sp.]